MENAISKEYNFKNLCKYAWPTIAMFLFMSLYTIVDGFFVANFVGDNAIAAINIVYPIFQLFAAIGLMFGTGGSALLSHKIGANKQDEVHHDFTALIIISITMALLITIGVFVFENPLLHFLGNNQILDQYARPYLFWINLGGVIIVLKYITGNMLMAAGQPKLGLATSILGGILNIGLDYLFIVTFNLGIVGAALGTLLSMLGSALLAISYFIKPDAHIHFAKPHFNLKCLLKAMGNGSSEMVSQLAVGITTLMFNKILLDIAGPPGVTAICIILYLQYLMIAIFLGFSSGVAPIISYNYGANKHSYLKKLLKYGLFFITISSILVLIISYTTDDLMTKLFVHGQKGQALTHQGIILFSISYAFIGYNIFISSWFTALNDGKISAILSFFKNLFLVIVALLILPKVWGVIGVWLAIPIAEFIALIISIYFLVIKRKKYHY